MYLKFKYNFYGVHPRIIIRKKNYKGSKHNAYNSKCLYIGGSYQVVYCIKNYKPKVPQRAFVNKRNSCSTQPLWWGLIKHKFIHSR